MSLPKIHLISPAGSCRPFLEAMNLTTAAKLIDVVQQTVGSNYLVTGNTELIETRENELLGGRTDDRERASDLEAALLDNNVAAIVLLRGGAWFTRILHHIDFTVLANRRRPVAVFGFSELTTLVNIVAGSPNAFAIYDMGPAFLTYGLKRHAARSSSPTATPQSRPADAPAVNLETEVNAFFVDLVSMIEGRGTRRTISAQLIAGEMPDSCTARFVGGNLTVLSTMVGSTYEGFVKPVGRWLLLEDFNDKLERIDRFLAHLTLAGYWSECKGLLLGDFHKGYENQVPAVAELLPFHIPAELGLPVLATQDVGHVWPMSPIPLHVPLTIERTNSEQFRIHWPISAIQTV